MSFEFNVEKVESSGGGNSKQVDWDARSKYIIDKVGTQKKAKAMIGIISGIIDLGLQVQEDAKMEWKGTDEERAEVEAKAERGESQEYFETLPNEKQVPTLYKRWPVKPCQQVAFTVDFPSIGLNQSQFFGEDDGKEHPLRLLLNGEFYTQGVGKIVGKPYNIKENRNDDGSWSFKSNTQIHKLASATDVLDDNGRFKPAMIGKLLGKAALFEVQVFSQESGGKNYLNEKIKLSGQVPDVMVPMIPVLDEQYIYGINFKGEQNPELLKHLRQSVINTMKQAQNYEGSDLAKALEGRSGSSEAEAPKAGDKPTKPEPAPNYDSFDDSFDDDIPF